ncbi:Major facilitator-type transporter ecdD [Paramyrothecium foliicola]|nr:Major facilitator-type transporter ecdD [Paramyrothecium foliicola]
MAPSVASATSIAGVPARRSLLGHFNGRLFYSCALVALSQVNFGADQAAFANTQAMPFFKQQFGWYDDKTRTYILKTTYLSLLNSLNYIGFVFGLIFGNLVSRRWGRRIAMFSMCFWALIAAIILVTSRHREQMIVGRCVAYIYIGMELALVPVLQSELVPREVRGFVVGTYQSGLLIGSLVMSGICRGTSDIPSHASWRIPLGLFFIIPSILLIGVWWLPESPRWLLTQNRADEALASLRLLRQGAYSEEQITEEFRHIERNINVVVEKGSFKELFQGTNLKRTVIVVGTNVFLQLTGQNFASVYGTIFIQSLGTVNPYTMSTVNTAINIVVVFACQYLADKVGRKPLMATGSLFQVAALMTMGGLGTIPNPSHGVKTGIVSMLTIFGAGFSFGWAPLSHVVAAEIPTNRLRDLTYAFGSVFNIVIQFAVSFSIPYLLNEPYAGLGSKVGFIFGSTAVCALLFTIFCIPDCSGKTLEEIDQLFIQGVPVGKFGTRLSGLSDIQSEEDVKVGVKSNHASV